MKFLIFKDDHISSFAQDSLGYAYCPEIINSDPFYA